MLTQNFSEIIYPIKQKLESNTINVLSADEIGNISLMLRGYLGLIQNGYATQNDSALPSEQYFTFLINILSQLTPIQEQKIKNQKQSLLDTLMAEINTIFNQMDSILQPKNSTSPALKALNTSKELLCKELVMCSNNQEQGSMDLIRTAFDYSNRMKEQFIRLKHDSKMNELMVCEEQFALVTTSYLKKMTHVYTLEKDNNHSISYVASYKFRDYLINC